MLATRRMVDWEYMQFWTATNVFETENPYLLMFCTAGELQLAMNRDMGLAKIDVI